MFRTKRLLLYTAEEIRVEEMMDYYIENQVHLKPYEPIRDGSFYTFREQSMILAQDVERLQMQTGLKLFLKRHEKDKVIGILNFSQIVMGAFCSCIVGYGLAGDSTGQGYMGEALEKGIEIMFDTYGLHRIEANVMPRNLKSINLLKGLGFHEEGLALKYLKINGVWEDHIHFARLNDEI